MCALNVYVCEQQLTAVGTNQQETDEYIKCKYKYK